MTAGDVGVTFTAEVTGYSLTGATCNLLVELSTNTNDWHNSFPLTVSGDGTSASLVTTGAEFPFGGTYNTWVQIIGPGNVKYNVGPVPIVVKSPPV